MITIDAFGYTVTIDQAGRLTSDDADPATLRTLQAGADLDKWAAPVAEPYATLHALQMRYTIALVTMPAMVNPNTAGEIIY